MATKVRKLVVMGAKDGCRWRGAGAQLAEQLAIWQRPTRDERVSKSINWREGKGLPWGQRLIEALRRNAGRAKTSRADTAAIGTAVLRKERAEWEEMGAGIHQTSCWVASFAPCVCRGQRTTAGC